MPHPPHEPSHDPSAPVVLRTDPRTRHVMQSYLGGIIGLFVVLMILNATGVIHRPPGAASPMPMSLAIILLLVGTMLAVHRGRVVLGRDTVTVTRGWGRTRTFARAEIVARRVHPAGWRRSFYHELFLRDGTSVKLPPYLEAHAPLREFLAGIPIDHAR